MHLKLSIPKPYAGEDRKIISILIRMHLGITPGSSTGKEPSCNAGELGSIPGLGRSPGEGNHYSLQYSGLENSMDYSPWGRKELDMTERLSLHRLQ